MLKWTFLNRSERASSLALPLNSLLDFYDKQQEQCKSVTLLPLPSNSGNSSSSNSSSSIVRRHSSHYYPMLEDKQKPSQLPPQAATQMLVSSGVYGGLFNSFKGLQNPETFHKLNLV